MLSGIYIQFYKQLRKYARLLWRCKKAGGRVEGEAGTKGVAVQGVWRVFEPALCSGGGLRLFGCKVWRDGLLVFGSVQVGEGSSCPCL
jgi:hypothetical protein